ncbi:helix-turn-helix transcriptional regulator [Salmonella enterica subsp. enterica serovar Javiana]|nr:helix-turn-helix transcriptional regulator [Salmonella enterica subsp. enterica serovar Javiana]
MGDHDDSHQGVTLSIGYAEKLTQIRKAEGLTQAKLAEITGVSLGSIKNYESGQKEVGLLIVSKFTNHPRFEKYTLWLMSEEGKTNEAAGQISPALSPDGQDSTSSRRNAKRAG